MIRQLPVIIVIFPMLVSVVASLAGQRYKQAAFVLAFTAMSVCLGASAVILNQVISHGAVQYELGGWAPPVGIVYHIDHLNAFILVLISFIGLVTVLYAPKSIEKELPGKITLFWCLFLLLITGLLGIAVTGDLFNLFVFIEVASLTGYALVAAGNKKATVAGIRYLLLGSVGASFYLLGVGYLYMATGTLNMADLAQLLPRLYHSKTVLLGFSFILVGLGIKTALFPMHGWLPDAYTYAPSAVSAVVAPLTTKVMAYVMIRIMFTVFEPEFSITVLGVTPILVWMGTLAVLYGAVTALFQKDFKRMLAYVIIAEIGYIIGGIGVANTAALKGAVFHIINDAVMTACLFLTAGLVMYQKGGHHIDDFKGIFKTMPVTAAVFTIGALGIIGVPPTGGFFSKWYLLFGGIQAGQWGFVAALLICTAINMVLFFRVFDRGFFLHRYSVPDQSAPYLKPGTVEAPVIMLMPAVLTAAAILVFGIFNQYIINEVFGFRIL